MTEGNRQVKTALFFYGAAVMNLEDDIASFTVMAIKISQKDLRVVDAPAQSDDENVVQFPNACQDNKKS